MTVWGEGGWVLGGYEVEKKKWGSREGGRGKGEGGSRWKEDEEMGGGREHAADAREEKEEN